MKLRTIAILTALAVAESLLCARAQDEGGGPGPDQEQMQEQGGGQGAETGQEQGQRQKPGRGKKQARGGKGESRNGGSETITEEQKAGAAEIVSKYDAASLSAEDAKAIHKALRDLGVRGGPSEDALLVSVGFDPEMLKKMDPPPDRAGKRAAKVVVARGAAAPAGKAAVKGAAASITWSRLFLTMRS